MASKKQDAGGKKPNDKTSEKTKAPLSNQGKKEPKQADLTKKIKNLEDEKKRLLLENVMFKNNFDLKEIIKALSKPGVTEVDGIEMAHDMIKKALIEAEEKHSAEIKTMEKNHKKEIETLTPNLQGEDQLPFNSNNQDVTDGKPNDDLKRLLVEKQQLTKALDEEKMKHANDITELESKHKGEIDQLKRDYNSRDQLPTDSSGDSKHSQETDQEIDKFRELEREVESLKADKDELNKNINKMKTETESLKKKLEENKFLLRKKEEEILQMKENETHVQTREKSKSEHLEKEETKNHVNHNHEGEKTAPVNKKDISAEMQNVQLTTTEQMQMKEENKNLKDKLKQTEELLNQKESAIRDLQQELANHKTRISDTISKPVVLEDIRLQMREATTEKEKLRSEKSTLEAAIAQLQDENKKQKQSYETLKKQKEKEKGELIAEKQQKDAEIKTLQEENRTLKQSEEINKNMNEKLKKLEQEKDYLNKQVTELQKENDDVKYRLKESQSPSLSNVISANDNKAVQQLKAENERLRTRLSEVAGAQMTLNNPNIADLSDVFRPTKLSEEYSQLYDNLWTDAFEEHDGKKEEDIIQTLRKTLLGSYTFCESVCRDFTVQLTNASLALPNSKPKMSDIPIVYKKQLQDMKKSFGVFLRNDVKESYRKQNAIAGGDKTKNYIDACVELCWLMVIQEPPVVIETPATKDSPFDSDTYRTYTKTGTKVDFVVWPALRLHQGGPLLTKGVAQGKN